MKSFAFMCQALKDPPAEPLPRCPLDNRPTGWKNLAANHVRSIPGAQRLTAKEFVPSARRAAPHREGIYSIAKGVCLLALSLVLAGGCTPKKPPVVTNNNPQTPQDTQADLPGKITGTGFHIPITRRDPKNPNGPPIPILTADAQSGTLQNEGDNPATFLEGVRARLFRNGKPAADLFAPQMTYDRSKKTVIATGGVKLVSLPTPSQTTVTADQMTWDTSTSHIVAVGHAFATTHQNGTDIQQSGGRITIDMARKPYEITIGD